MLTDSDVESLDRALRFGRLDRAAALVVAIERELEQVDLSVQIMFAALRGIVAARAGDPVGGHDQVMAALTTAREHRLVWEEHECLVALIDIDEAGGPTAPADARSRRADIAAALELVGRSGWPT
jgi:hypothetical protein